MRLMADILRMINDRLKPHQIVLMAMIGIFAIVVAIFLFLLDSSEKGNADIQVSQKDKEGQTIGVVRGDLIGTPENKFDKETRQKINAIYNKIQEGSFPTKNESNPIEKKDIFAIIGDLLTTTNERSQLIARALKFGNIDEANELLKKLDEEQDALNESFDKSLTRERVTTKLERAALLTWSNPNESYSLLKEATKLDSENLQALNQLGHISLRLGNMNDAASAYQHGLEIARRNHDRAQQGTFLGNLGSVYLSLGDYSQAKKYLLDALAISREIGDRRGEGSSLGNLGLVFRSLGDYEQAKQYHLDALAISREIGDRQGEGSSLSNLGLVFFSLGDYEQAKQYHLDALAISREIGDRKGEDNRLGNLGLVFFSLGDDEQAKQYLLDALAISREIGDKQGESNHLSSLGLVFYRLGDYSQAKKYLLDALTISREIGDRRGEGSSLANLGLVFKQLDDLLTAKEHWQQALAIFEDIGSPEAEQISGWLEELDKQ